jgi:hypothetical protein
MEIGQRRLTLAGGIDKDGFRGFIKQEQNGQTYYIFLYDSLV